MQDLNMYISENFIPNYEVSLDSLEMLALHVMIDVTDCSDIMKNTKHKIETSLKSHVTHLLRKYPDIAKNYDYKTLFKEKTKEEANDLLDVIISEFRMRQK